MVQNEVGCCFPLFPSPLQARNTRHLVVGRWLLVVGCSKCIYRLITHYSSFILSLPLLPTYNNAMNILVIGPGAIGCLFAGLLSEGGHSVQILDKNAKRTALLNKQGIKIKDGETRTVKIPAITNIDEADTPRFICICVKSFDTESAMQSALDAIDANTYVVSVQNGIGNAEIISNYINPEKILCTSTSQGATLLKPGSIKRAGTGPTSVAPFTPESYPAA
jgi:2-dehydropantoate 2-reductase